jgi:hypothetical protein
MLRSEMERHRLGGGGGEALLAVSLVRNLWYRLARALVVSQLLPQNQLAVLHCSLHFWASRISSGLFYYTLYSFKLALLVFRSAGLRVSESMICQLVFRGIANELKIRHNLLTHTHSMAQNIIWKADCHSAYQKISCFLYGTRRFVSVFTKALPPDILSQLNPVRPIHPYLPSKT